MVLENRHVLLLFFVVVVLCGVFFGLGYIVGKNTMTYTAPAQGTTAATAAKEKEQAKKNPLEETGDKKPGTAESDLTYQKTLEGKGAAPGLEAAQPAGQGQPAATATAPAATEAKPAAPPATPAAPPADAGTVIQVGALKNRADADNVAGTLREKGFTPVIEQQADGLFHVYIPAASPKDADELKARVEKAGFKAFIKKK
jgi:cell division septation protein DedD